MKPTVDNRSTRKTKNAIENAFIELLQKKSIDKIKISEIVDGANVNRSTFYVHYFDVYDLRTFSILIIYIRKLYFFHFVFLLIFQFFNTYLSNRYVTIYPPLSIPLTPLF